MEQIKLTHRWDVNLCKHLVLPHALIAVVGRKLLERTKDEDADVRNRAKWTHGVKRNYSGINTIS